MQNSLRPYIESPRSFEAGRLRTKGERLLSSLLARVQHIDARALPKKAMHLTLLALLVMAGWRLMPLQASRPSVGGLQAPLTSDPSSLVPSSDLFPSSHCLEPNAVPYTVRVMGDVLPLVAAPQEVRAWVITYTVQPGDTVSGIAERFGLQSTSILWANDRIAEHPDYLQVGQEVLIPPVDGALHVVANGDTIDSIAKAYTVDPETITSFPGNHLEDGQALTVGERLVIPGGQKQYRARRVYAYSGNPPADANRGSGSFAWPMSGYITQGYWSQHRAIDIGAVKGTPIYAADSGYVSYVQFSNSGYGNMAMIDHRNGYVTLYAHMSVVVVDMGQSITKGQLVGYCGSTGHSTGPHLHFEVIENGVKRNPFIYLP